MSDQSRRKLLKSIAAGSGAIVAGKSLPDSWSRPVVDYVLLPVHAQTSPCCVDFCNFSTSSDAVDVAAASFCNGQISVSGGGFGPGSWSGSGPVATDGSFSFQVIGIITGPDNPIQITGNVNCTNLNGLFDSSITFSGNTNCG